LGHPSLLTPCSGAERKRVGGHASFLSKIEFELKEHFFKYHSTEIPNLRYLIGIPTMKQEKIDEILASAKQTKEDLQHEHYKLFN
jgi:hypothetical protein